MKNGQIRVIGFLNNLGKIMSNAIVLVESHYRTRSWFLALKDIGLTHIISVMPEEYKLFIKNGFKKKIYVICTFHKKNRIKKILIKI